MSQKSKDSLKELAQEIDVLDKMLSSLVEVLEEKGILTQEEWEDKVKVKIKGKKNLKSFRDI
jgi:DNA-binding HxlR family transcriptional regulator